MADGSEAEQPALEEAPVPDAAPPPGVDAMVRAVFAVEVLGTSPGNCTAVSGLADGEPPAPRFAPVVAAPDDPDADPDPSVADPVATAPVAAPIVDPPGTDELEVSDAFGVFDGFGRQPDADAGPLEVVPGAGHDVAVTPVPAGFVPAALMPGCGFSWELVWA